jgi:guanylate kinase
MISQAQLEEVRAGGGALRETRRYGAVYVIDLPEIKRMLSRREVPVLHVGQPADVAAVISALPGADVTVAALECPRDIALERIEARQTGDTAARLAAYDATPPLIGADVQVDTGKVDAQDAAVIIHRLVLASAGRAHH